MFDLAVEVLDDADDLTRLLASPADVATGPDLASSPSPSVRARVPSRAGCRERDDRDVGAPRRWRRR